ncbi:MAG TPA: DUF47 family protein [Bdellovibrionota bacterium]|jgi:predicted phosphate transport protein (TIGR00153 family)|nr:DUF47 family protein [Bdellovibrionota bacterium]
MIGSIFPREVKFFELFSKQGDLCVEAAETLQQMVRDLGKAEGYARRIEDLEHKADDNTHTTIDLVHQTFITPIDREDILLLASRLDDVMDYIEASAQLLHLYDVRQSNVTLEELADVVLQCVRRVRDAVAKIDNLKHADEIHKLCVDIHRLENEADGAQRRGLAKLFREEQDTRQLIKLKEIYELMERVTDNCEDVANVIEGLLVEYA